MDKKPDMSHTAPDELANESELHIHQRRWLLIRRVRVAGGQSYRGSFASFFIG